MTDQPADQPTNQPPAAVPGWTPPPTPEKPKKPVWQKPWFLILAAVVVLGILGSIFGNRSPQTAAPAASAPATTAPDPTPTETETEDPEPAEPTKDDFELTLKITEKQCFGSAGCNVGTKVSVSYVGIEDLEDLPSNIDITFDIKGGEDPYTATIEMEDGKYSPDTALIQTKSSKSKLTVKITAVESY